MKNLVALIVLISCMLAPVAFAGDDTSVTAEFIWGFGGSTNHKGFTLRVENDSIEAHVARWFGTRNNTAFGVGLIAGDDQKNNRYLHISGTIGLSYVLQTNTVLSNHLQPFFRVAAGTDVDSDGDAEIELSYSRYGLEEAEQFAGLGLRINNRHKTTKSPSIHKPETPDDSDDCVTDCDSTDGDDGNNGHGNDDDGCDESNPGNGGPPSCG